MRCGWYEGMAGALPARRGGAVAGRVLGESSVGRRRGPASGSRARRLVAQGYPPGPPVVSAPGGLGAHLIFFAFFLAPVLTPAFVAFFFPPDLNSASVRAPSLSLSRALKRPAALG